MFSQNPQNGEHESNWASNASDQSYYDNDFVTAESGALETNLVPRAFP